jgi:molecular chaperone GrpE
LPAEEDEDREPVTEGPEAAPQLTKAGQQEAESEEPETTEEARKELERLTKQKQESERKAADYFGRLQRLQADMENLQKLTQKQTETASRQASEKILGKLLPILDALQQAENIAKTNNSLPPDEIALGLKMLHEQLMEVLSSEGLEEIASVGKALDPALHEVVSYVETDDVPENRVLEEIRKGYLLNGKVVRPSLVIVSKPKPKEAP